MKIEANVGSSDDSDPIKAARKAAIESLGGMKNPKVSIVFSTIQYEKNLKDMLIEIRSIINAPLVGCTGAGVLVSETVYTRGIGILTISGDVDIGVGVGEGSRTGSVKAGIEAYRSALSNLGKTEYKNRYGILLTSGVKFPDIPGMMKLMKMGISKKMLPMLMDLMAKMGTGPAQYEEVLSGVVSGSEGKLNIVGGGAIDDFKGRRNFQFLNEKVYHDSVVLLLIASNARFNVAHKHGLKSTRKKMDVTKAKGAMAFEINNKSAWEGFKETYEIPPELEDKWKGNPAIMAIYQVPAERDSEDNYWINTPLCVVGDAILFAKNVDEGELYVCKASGEDILYAAKEATLEATRDIKPIFSLIFSPIPRIMAMMEHIDVERQYIKEVLGDTPFLGLYCCASQRHSTTIKTIPKCLNETIVVAVFGE